jgi:hypothetical protein
VPSVLWIRSVCSPLRLRPEASRLGLNPLRHGRGVLRLCTKTFTSVPTPRGSARTPRGSVQNPFVLGPVASCQSTKPFGLCPEASRIGPDFMCQSTKPFCMPPRELETRYNTDHRSLPPPVRRFVRRLVRRSLGVGGSLGEVGTAHRPLITTPDGPPCNCLFYYLEGIFYAPWAFPGVIITGLRSYWKNLELPWCASRFRKVDTLKGHAPKKRRREQPVAAVCRANCPIP